MKSSADPWDRPVRVVGAAGGVLWRPTRDGRQIAVVHRPRYDDWSLPKGKLRRREHPLLGALREVEEETGYRAWLGPPLGEYRYLTDGGRTVKTVRYWAMQARSGTFVPTREVDRLAWLAKGDAARRVSYDTDRHVLAEFGRLPAGRLPAPTAALVVIRHARAAHHRRWDGPDRLRPLDERGRAQANALVPLLTSLGIRLLISADLPCCTATLAPYARAAGLAVEPEPALADTGYPGSEARVVATLMGLAASGTPTAICSQRTIVADLIRRLLDGWCWPVPDQLGVREGGFWLLHCPPGRLVAAERHDPVA
ncbi:hypothetical protein CcI6DRAFT_00533 [Frankia sp. CcI6]|uniref:NUDIX hydrolase n=1 Tax=Frankia TaxID=1854 RepID=UPI0003CFACF5|nr:MULTISPECIES: NUDIX hydrolase [Frankia]ETA04009.1 hypothetical protein CcI6DRAFT_00533 [Frankia sp. CcI6]KFB06907.1 phosphoglycerate mutase family protein [Frankia sp. Allo2]OAA30756.1 8-oxo-dGTP diphosphatase [Frankia casuarinae]